MFCNRIIPKKFRFFFWKLFFEFHSQGAELKFERELVGVVPMSQLPLLQGDAPIHEDVQWESVRAHLMAGALARAAAATLLFPLDTVKARLQFQPHPQSYVCVCKTERGLYSIPKKKHQLILIVFF